MNQDMWTRLKEALIKLIVDFGPHLIYAIVALVIGVFMIKLTMRFISKFLIKSKVEPTLRTFVLSLSVFLLYALLIFVAGRILGIEASSFLAMFGAAALAIGFALQGSLANFAGGVLILAFKPFKINDLVYINNHLGIVDQIDILYTRIKTYDGRIITMPNGKVANDDMDNRSTAPYRRVEVDLNFSFDENFDQLRELLTATLEKHPNIVKDQPVQVWLTGMGDYAMKVSARCWAHSDDYWDIYFDQTEAVKRALDQNGIHLAIPKRAIYQEERVNSVERI